jgi:UDP-N-acetylmuramate dehydrogenase
MSMTEEANALERFCAAAARVGAQVIRGEPLVRHTTFRIGGPAELYVEVGEREQLAQLTELAAQCGVPYKVLGGGSNVLVSDAGIRGLVVVNQTRTIRTIVEGPAPAGELPQVVADAGVPLAGLARWAIRAGWSGLEWAVSVPGTVGGAVIGNAGAHGGEISASLAWALISYPLQGQKSLFEKRS